MTHEELLEIIEKEKADQAKYRHVIRVCASTGCVSANSEQIVANLEAEIKERGLENEVHVMKVGCLGLCAAGPIVSVQPEGLLYGEMTPEDATAILDSLDGEPMQAKLIDTSLSFFYRQEKNALENAGQINPERIEDYIATGGYAALLKALNDLSPNQVIQ
ncbi:NADH-quinone oxidoreductase subunit L, partial [bacterium]